MGGREGAGQGTAWGGALLGEKGREPDTRPSCRRMLADPLAVHSRLRFVRFRQADPRIRHGQMLGEMFTVGSRHPSQAPSVGDQPFQHKAGNGVQVAQIDD